jgi:hypothetical protein
MKNLRYNSWTSFCGGESIFSYTCVPKKKVPIEIAPGTSAQTLKVVSEGVGMSRESSTKSKILTHFIKGKISLSPMEQFSWSLVNWSI